MLQHALFISFPVRHTDNFRFDGRHCIGVLIIKHIMIRKLLYSEFDRKVSIGIGGFVIGLGQITFFFSLSMFQMKVTNLSDKSNNNNSFC